MGTWEEFKGDHMGWAGGAKVRRIVILFQLKNIKIIIRIIFDRRSQTRIINVQPLNGMVAAALKEVH